MEITEANKELQERILDLDSHMWNPVEESVPSDGRYILLSFENFSLPEIGRYEEDEEGGGSFYAGDDDKPLTSYGLFVNAWMELPERYRG